jgi:hypothetical protein
MITAVSRRANTIESFWALVAKLPGDGCWVWQGHVSSNGYGKMGYGGKAWYVHRLSYEIARGPIPLDLTIDHLCRNKRCVNPTHLETVPMLVNVARGNPLKTHCKRGHALTAENLYANKHGIRVCRLCGIMRQRIWLRANREHSREYQRSWQRSHPKRRRLHEN